MSAPLYDVLSSFEAGMNSGVQPLLLQKNQLANLTNGTVRGGYVTHRPPKKTHTIEYGDEAIEDIFQNGKFQGAGVYRGDDGVTRIIVQIQGQLYVLTEAGNVWNLVDATIATPAYDPNNVDTLRTWMWQAEKWMIISGYPDKLPIFYDGITARRSDGPSVLLATGTGFNPANPPPIGDTVTLTTSVEIPDIVGKVVIMNGELYEVTSSAGVPASNISLENINGTLGDTIPEDALVQATGSYVGTIDLFFPQGNIVYASKFNVLTEGIYYSTFVYEIKVSVTFVVQPALGSIINILGKSYSVYLSGTKTIYARRQEDVSSPTPVAMPSADVIPVGSHITLETPVAGVTYGTLDADVITPAVGASVAANMTITNTFGDGTVVLINGYYFKVTNAVTADSASLTLKNLTDTPQTPAVPYPDPSDILSLPEIPECRFGAYGQGRVWYSSLDGISFGAGDLVGSMSGTSIHSYRDAVLKGTENTFLESRGTFQLPSSGNHINSMVFLALLDQTLGQGPLSVGTAESIFACQVPVDRATWAALETPILPEVLIGLGPTEQCSTIVCNSDLFFRTPEGVATLQMARRDFQNWGNTPISREVESIIAADDRNLLAYGSALFFDNRMLMTAKPSLHSRGILHSGCIALNFDAVSNIRGKLPPCWDGYWNDLSVLQFFSGTFNSVRRAFYFGVDANGYIALNEILKTDAAYVDDVDTPITWSYETSILFNKDVKPLDQVIQLLNGEMSVRDIRGEVGVTVEFRPDYYPCWTQWAQFTLSADSTSNPGYRNPVVFGEPSVTPCEEANNRPLRNGQFFQLRLTFVGSLKSMRLRAAANVVKEADFGNPICNQPVVNQTIECDLVAP